MNNALTRDAQRLASRVEALLAPYMTKGGIKGADKVDIEVAERLFKLYDMLRQHGRHTSLEEGISDFESEPDDPDARAAFRHQLKKTLRQDLELTAKLPLLVEEIEDRLEATVPHPPER